MAGDRYVKIGTVTMLLAVVWSALLSLPIPSFERTFQPEAARFQSSQLASDVSTNPIVFLRTKPPDSTSDASTRELERGRQAYQQGQFESAAHHFQNAVQASTGLEQAFALSYLSSAQQRQGHWNHAQESISQSLELAHQFPGSRLQQLVLGRAFNTQGSFSFERGDARAALQAWQQAEIAYKAGQDKTRQLGSLLNQSQAFQSLGYYSRARQILEKIGQSLESEPVAFQITGLHHLGEIYWRIGELQKSEAVLIKAEQKADEIQDRSQQSAILISLGNTKQAQKLTQQAFQYYQQAAKLGSEKTQFQATLNQFRLSILLDQTTAQDLIPQLNHQLEMLPASRETLYGAANFAEGLAQLAFAGNVPPLTANALTNRLKNFALEKTAPALFPAKTPTPTSQARLAVTTLAWVLKTANAMGDQRALAYGQGYLGHIYERAQQWDAAQALTQQAIATAKRIQAKDISYQWQWQAARIHQAQAEIAVPAEAQAHLQAARVAYHMSFDLLSSLRSDLVAVRPDLQFSFQEQVEPVYREFVELLIRLNEGSPPDSPESEATLQLARHVLESLQVAELNNFFRAACIQDQIVAIDEIERDNTAVLYPIILRDRLTVIWSLPGQPLRSHSTLVKRTEVEKVLLQFRDNLELNYTSPEGKDAGEKLYNWLIQPIDKTLQENQIQTLTFILDAPLRNVPMSALYERKRNHYLVQDYSIALTPGLRLLAPKPLDIRGSRTLLAGLSKARNQLSALPYVEEELNRLSQVVRSKVLLNQTFTQEALRKHVKTSAFPVVHLATHGQFSSDAEKTFISVWDGQISIAQLSSALRGRIRPDPIELLVLSACETASGDSRAALGLAGLSVQAGARSTLASLWNLDDESGAVFAEKFYKALASGKLSRAEALRAAQLELLKDPRYRKPQSWASYVLVGNWL